MMANLTIDTDIFVGQTEMMKVRRHMFEHNEFDDELDDLENLLRESNRKECPQEDGESEEDYVDRIEDECNDTIRFMRVDKESTLWYALNAWFNSRNEKMADVIRGYVEDGSYFYYITGIGYDTVSSDLLGGEADGKLKHEFLEFINN